MTIIADCYLSSSIYIQVIKIVVIITKNINYNSE